MGNPFGIAPGCAGSLCRCVYRFPPVLRPHRGGTAAASVRRSAADLPAGAGNLGLADNDRRKAGAHHPLGKCDWPEQKQRHCGGHPHGFPEPRGSHPVRRRKLDDHRCRLQGRNLCEQGTGEDLRPAGGRLHFHWRDQNEVPAHHPAAGSAAVPASDESVGQLHNGFESDPADPLSGNDRFGLSDERG